MEKLQLRATGACQGSLAWVLLPSSHPELALPPRLTWIELQLRQEEHRSHLIHLLAAGKCPLLTCTMRRMPTPLRPAEQLQVQGGAGGFYLVPTESRLWNRLPRLECQRLRTTADPRITQAPGP